MKETTAESLLDMLAGGEEVGGRRINEVAAMEALLIEQRRGSSEREGEAARPWAG